MTPDSHSSFLVQQVLYFADNALILGHRNSEWCGHGPVLEQDIAITNISLDLIGQARNFYQYAASLVGNGATEDTLAYLRDAGEFRHCLINELPKGDWAFTILRQFFFSAYQYYVYQALRERKDEQLAAIASKALKEVSYHLRWSSEWVIRLGDGTAESNQRINKAINELWPYTGELFEPAAFEKEAAAAGIGVDPGTIEPAWTDKVKQVFSEAKLNIPGSPRPFTGGKSGKHSEHLDAILSELQYMQRTYPGCEW